jgi:hypothetical protein
MRLLIGWCWIAAAVLLVSAAAHASTFLGIDPIAMWPGVMLIHLAIFPPFFAALYYAPRSAGKEQRHQDNVIAAAPAWLRILAGVCFIYAFVNFGIFIVLSEGGGPHERDGRYFIMSHGTVLRELSEAEFHQHQAYEVRGFSGHWMLFSSASLMVLVGTARLRRRRSAASDQPSASPPEPPAAPPVVVEAAGPAREEGGALPPEPTTRRAGVVALLLYAGCLALILSDRPALALFAVPPVAIFMVLAMRRRRGFPHRSFETFAGCLTVFPNALLASRMGWLVAEFIYVAAYVGIEAAWSHDVTLTFPREGPAQLSNGDLLHNRVVAALMGGVMFPLFVVGTIGLTSLAERAGRLIEGRRCETTPAPRA